MVAPKFDRRRAWLVLDKIDETLAWEKTKEQGYMLEMICADFLAGANLDTADCDALTLSLDRLFEFLPQLKKKEFLDNTRRIL
jgi:hypothetical protein